MKMIAMPDILYITKVVYAWAGASMRLSLLVKISTVGRMDRQTKRHRPTDQLTDRATDRPTDQLAV